VSAYLGDSLVIIDTASLSIEKVIRVGSSQPPDGLIAYFFVLSRLHPVDELDYAIPRSMGDSAYHR
jgi:hypothetical protein